MSSNKLFEIAKYNTKFNDILGVEYDSFIIYQSKGLLTHLIKRKHFVAAKYLEFLPDIIQTPDYIGETNGNIEFVKCYMDNIFICVKLDSKKKIYYVSTVFDIKSRKIDSYVKSGRLIRIND